MELFTDTSDMLYSCKGVEGTYQYQLEGSVAGILHYAYLCTILQDDEY